MSLHDITNTCGRSSCICLEEKVHTCEIMKTDWYPLVSATPESSWGLENPFAEHAHVGQALPFWVYYLGQGHRYILQRARYPVLKAICLCHNYFVPTTQLGCCSVKVATGERHGCVPTKLIYKTGAGQIWSTCLLPRFSL